MPARAIAASAAILLLLTCGGIAQAGDGRLAQLARAVPYVFDDQRGDANAINDQGGALPIDPTTQTPISSASADIISVRYSRLDDGRRVRGIKISLTLARVPGAGFLYRIAMRSEHCPILWFQLQTPLGGVPQSELRHNCSQQGAEGVVTTLQSVPLPFSIAGRTITWTLSSAAFPDGIRVNSALRDSRAESRLLEGVGTVVASTAPVVDETATQKVAYRIGQ